MRRTALLVAVILTASVLSAAPTVAAPACGGSAGFGQLCEVDVGVGFPIALGSVPLDGGGVIAMVGDVSLSSPSNIGVRVVDGADNVVCQTNGLFPCTLPSTGGTGQVQLDGPAGRTGRANVYVNSLVAPQGCTSGPPIAWGTPGQAIALPEAGSTSCRTFAVDGGSYTVSVATDEAGVPPLLSQVVASDGRIGCQVDALTNACVLTAGEYQLYTASVDGAVTGRRAVYDRGSTEGCGSLGPAFGQPGSSGTLATAEWACHEIQGQGGGPSFLVRTGPATDGTGTDSFVSTIVSADGSESCAVASLLLGQPCLASGAGPWRVLTRGFSSSDGGNGVSGDFAVAVGRADAPRQGCVPHQVGTTTSAVTTSTVSIECFEASLDVGETVGARMLVGADNTGGGLVTLVGGDGAPACDGDSVAGSQLLLATCTVATSGPHAFITSPADQAAGRAYDLVSTCEGESTCGTGEALIDGVDPGAVGNMGTVTFTVTGQNLLSITEATLSGPGGTVTAVGASGADLGTLAAATFTLEDLTPGTYELAFTAPGGTATIPVTVEATEAPDITVTIAGDDATRPDRPVTVIIHVDNGGNVDALGVPVFVELPASADVEFHMDVLTPPVPDAFGDGFDFSQTTNSYDHTNGPPPSFAGGSTDGSGNPTGSGGFLGGESINDLPFDTQVFPIIVPFVPARGRVSIPATVTPREQGNNSMSATPGRCLVGTPHQPDGDGLQYVDPLTGQPLDCFNEAIEALILTGNTAIGIVPGGDCAAEVAQTTVSVTNTLVGFAQQTPARRDLMFFGGDLLAHGIGITTQCLGEANLPAQVVASAYDAFNAGYQTGTAILACIDLLKKWTHRLLAFFSFDPNDISGPSGEGADRAIRSSTTLDYTVRFENDPEQATAAAQSVAVEVELDPLLDADTLRVGPFGFGDVIINPTATRLPLHAEVSLTAAQTPEGTGPLLVLVDIVRQDRTLSFAFDTRAPDGSDPGVLDGFLPPNTTAPEGQGFVTFSADGTATDGQVVPATASIVFDTNAPIITNTWTNLVDDTPPTVVVEPVGMAEGSSRLDVGWSGTDTGAGVDVYEVEVSDGAGGFDGILSPTRGTATTHAASRGSTVVFRVRAHDLLGNTSPWVQADPVTVDDDAVDRLFGDSRIATAIAISRATFPTARTAILARADQYPDALSAAPLAYQVGGPILLNPSAELLPQVEAELVRLGALEVIIVGGTSAISPAVADALGALGVDVRRVSGPTRFDTAAKVADLLPPSDTAYVVEGANADPGRGWPDALSIAPVAARLGRPLLLATTDMLPEPTAAVIRRRQPASVVIVGGTSAVGQGVASGLAAIAPVTRIAGDSRYTTSLLASDSSAGGVETTWLATGLSFPDALAAGPAVAAGGGRLLLVHGEVPAASQPVLDRLAADGEQVRVVRLVGGAAAISPATEQAVRQALVSAPAE